MLAAMDTVLCQARIAYAAGSVCCLPSVVLCRAGATISPLIIISCPRHSVFLLFYSISVCQECESAGLPLITAPRM